MLKIIPSNSTNLETPTNTHVYTYNYNRISQFQFFRVCYVQPQKLRTGGGGAAHMYRYGTFIVYNLHQLMWSQIHKGTFILITDFRLQCSCDT